MTRHLLAALQAFAARPGGWQGTASDLLAVLPADARQADATRLAVTLRAAAEALTAYGVAVSLRRQAGTGRRLIVLRPVGSNARERPSAA